MLAKFFLFAALLVGVEATAGQPTPDAALKRLMTGNARYASDHLLHPDRTSDRRESVVGKQEPFAIIVGCSDSRVPPEILFDEGVGDLFVVRVAGNVVGPVELDSIEFCAKAFHSPLIVVLGHQNCGAIRAVLSGQTEDIEAVADLIQPALKGIDASAKGALDAGIKANVDHVVEYLKSSPLLSRLAKEGKIQIVGAYYDLQNGEVTTLPSSAPAR